MSKYNTKQKEILLKFFEDSKDRHFTVEDIFSELNNQNIKIGKTTIYRNLDDLVKDDIIRKYFIEEGIGSCYQYNYKNALCNEHFHLKCLDCGSLIHMHCDFLDNLSQHLKKYHKFVIQSNKTVLYGKCDQCI